MVQQTLLVNLAINIMKNQLTYVNEQEGWAYA